MKFIIRDLKTYEEMLRVHQLQREIWGFTTPDVGLYPPMLNTAANNGGVVLGAFDAQSDQMIAFLFGFLGRKPGGPLKLCSQIMGVKQEWRGYGVGEALKWAQRERVLAQDLPLITWTFDPLEGPNAHLNLHKLRSISRTYRRDIYGSQHGSLNAGLPTDRLLVEWWVQGKWVSNEPDKAILDGQAHPIFELTGTGNTRQVKASYLDLDSDLLELDVLADLQATKAENLELAQAWRLRVREAFEAYFGRGYLAVDFLSTMEQGERRNRYLLARATPALLAQIGISDSDHEGRKL
jgi:predicted GNAT superfamily acetyltransferase